MVDKNKKNKSKASLDHKVIRKRLNKIEKVTVRHAHRFLVKRWDNIREVQLDVFLWILVMGALIGVVGLQMSWYRYDYQQDAPAKNSVYTEAVLGPIETLNPILAKTSAEKSAAYLMFSSILREDSSGNLNYDLAQSINIDSSGKIYTVTIRPGVSWHDEEPLTAYDIAFTIDLIKNPAIRSSIAGWDNVSIKVLDDYNIQFTLPTVYAAFDTALTFPILPEHILKDVNPANIRENDFSSNPIGSGVFEYNFTQTSDDDTTKVVYMIRNDNYYSGIASLSQFQLHAYDSRESIVEAILDGEISAATDMLPGDLNRFETTNNKVYSDLINDGVYAILNTSSEILNNHQVRKALQVGTNTEALIDTLELETKPLSLPFISSQVDGDLPTVPKYNIDQAKSILESDGWKLNSDGVREKSGRLLSIKVVAIKNSEFENILTVLAGQWRSIGFSVDTTLVDITDNSTNNFAQTILQPRNYDVLIYQLNIGSDPDVYAYWHSSQAATSGMNLANYSNAIADDALLSARTTLDDKLRSAKYITFAKQWLEDVPAIGLYQSTMQYVSSPTVISYGDEVKLVSPVDRYSNILNWSYGQQLLFKTP